MYHQQVVDPLLAPIIDAGDSTEVDRLVAELVSTHADPIIGGVVRRKVYGREHKQDVEDICSEARLHVLERLEQLREDPRDHQIDSFRDYVAMVAYHACDGYLRRAYPTRSRLKNRVRYFLERHPSFALWEHKDEKLAGFAVWQGSDASKQAQTKAQRLVQSPQDWPFAEGERSDPVALIGALFRHLGGPLEFNRLVEVVAAVWQVSDPLPEKAHPEREADQDPVERLPDHRPDTSTLVAFRVYLQRLWKEIRDLPLRQRAALLMNLRDARGASMIEFVPLCGIASIREIAALLDIEPARFAVLWNTLPLDDMGISRHLGVERQKIINLRKSAKERLARRMKRMPW